VTVIAVAAHKGGSGKTTIAANVAAALAADGRRVLAVDADPQGALGAALGVVEAKPTVYEVMAGDAKPDDAVRQVQAVAGLDVLPADIDLAGVELELAGAEGWPYALADAVSPLFAGYDVVMIDTAPGLGVLPMMALVAADAVVLACPPQFLSVRTLRAVRTTIDHARELSGRRLPVLGLVPTLVGRPTGAQSEVMGLLADDYAGMVLPAVPLRVAVERAAVAGVPVTHWGPSSEAAQVFRSLAQEVWSRAQTG
jgi:chromosome partitioning protein